MKKWIDVVSFPGSWEKTMQQKGVMLLLLLLSTKLAVAFPGTMLSVEQAVILKVFCHKFPMQHCIFNRCNKGWQSQFSGGRVCCNCADILSQSFSWNVYFKMCNLPVLLLNGIVSFGTLGSRSKSYGFIPLRDHFHASAANWFFPPPFGGCCNHPPPTWQVRHSPGSACYACLWGFGRDVGFLGSPVAELPSTSKHNRALR